MNESVLAPILVFFMWILPRILVPIAVLALIAYLLRKYGMAVIETAEDPNEENDEKESTKDES